jgi:DNA-binding CsgD family transcriptional regulator
VAASRLLEREAELAVLKRLIRAARRGRGAIALIEGPPGIGKSELARAAREQAEAAGMEVLAARAGELERDIAWGVVRALLEPALAHRGESERADLLAGAAGLAAPVVAHSTQADAAAPKDSAPALHGLYWLTANLAEVSPLIAIVDDAHWADPPSLRWLAYMARRIEELPILLLLVSRPREARAEEAGLAVELAVEPAEIIRPSALSEDGAGLMVRERLSADAASEFCRACHAATGGNPFLLHELIGQLAADRVSPTPEAAARIGEIQPETVSRAVLLRLRRLPETARELVRAVAVLESHATLGRAAELAGLGRDDAAQAADALASADILVVGRRLEFVHPLVRAAIYGEIPRAQRGEAHARAARLLERDGAASEDQAAHLLATEPAGDRATAAAMSAAAQDAAARGAPDAAAAYLRRALDEPAPEDEAPQLVWQLGRAEAAIAGPSAVPTLERALALAPEASKRAEIALDISRVLRMSAEFGHALEILEPALEELQPETPLSERVEGELINVAMLSGQSGARTAFERLVRFLDPAERDRVRDPRLLADLAAAAGVTGQPAELAAELAERALAAMPEGEAEPSVVAFAAHVLAYCDCFAAARRAADELAAQGAANGSLLAYGFAVALRSHVGYREGALGEAEADARNRIDIARDWAADPLEPVAFLTDVLVELGRLDEAEELLAAAPLAEHEGRWDALVLTGSRGRLRLAQGEPGAALEDLLNAGEQLVSGGAVNPAVMAWRSSAALAHHALGDRDEALRLAAEEVALARAFGAARALGIALRCRGIVTGGREGIELLEESVELLDGSGARLEHARSLCELGAALRRSRRRTAAAAPLREALHVATRCGADALAARAREELRAAGARPRRDALRGRDALTASELRIARMAATGATNRQIAQALFLTLRTVETHLTHAYRKLDIGSRAELADALARQAGGEPTPEPAPAHARR